MLLRRVITQHQFSDMKSLPLSYINSCQFLWRNETLAFLPGEMLGHICKSHTRCGAGG